MNSLLNILSPGATEQVDQATTALKIWAVATLLGVWLIAALIIFYNRK